MPVAPITYLYLILLVADILCLLLSLIKKDWEKLPVFVICVLLFGIGFSANYQICPMFFCIGRE